LLSARQVVDICILQILRVNLMQNATQNAKRLRREFCISDEPLGRMVLRGGVAYAICIIGHIQKDRFFQTSRPEDKYLSETRIDG
jgi:hypothetical protein